MDMVDGAVEIVVDPDRPSYRKRPRTVSAAA
jgi:hypothetical protein